MNGFPSKTRAFKGETEGWGGMFLEEAVETE